jgi:hypothetical protein
MTVEFSIILKCSVQIYRVRMWTGFIWLVHTRSFLNNIMHFPFCRKGKEWSDLDAYLFLNESYVLLVRLFILVFSTSYHSEVKSSI